MLSDKVFELRNKGLTIEQIAKQLKITKWRVRYHINFYNNLFGEVELIDNKVYEHKFNI